jgi:hypothetical protein
MELRYLFTAFMRDGSFIEQTQADRSRTTPEKNAYYDVLQRIDDVEQFQLTDIYGRQSVCVDLDTGLFEINDGVFRIGDRLSDNTKYRLVYFRRRHEFNSHAIAEPTEYHVGWEAMTPDGRKVRQTINFI